MSIACKRTQRCFDAHEGAQKVLDGSPGAVSSAAPAPVSDLQIGEGASVAGPNGQSAVWRSARTPCIRQRRGAWRKCDLRGYFAKHPQTAEPPALPNLAVPSRHHARGTRVGRLRKLVRRHPTARCHRKEGVCRPSVSLTDNSRVSCYSAYVTLLGTELFRRWENKGDTKLP